MLSRDVSEIRLADVYREFVFRADLTEGAEPSFESLVAQLTRNAHDALSMSLEKIFTMKAERPSRRNGLERPAA